MPLADCQERVDHSKIVLAEGRRKATFLNEERRNYVKTKMDGCVVKNETAADWVLSKLAMGDLVIELKGGDVEHATKQVDATAQYLQNHNLRIGRIAALIVAQQLRPAASTTVQRAQQSFSKKFSGPLHVATSNYEFVFERVLEYDGPR